MKFTFLIFLSSIICIATRATDPCINNLSVLTDTVPSTDNATFYISNTGSNNNDGKSSTSAKLNINSIVPLLTASQQGTAAVIALETNSVFREEFTPVNTSVLASFGKTPGGGRPKITGMDVIRDWTATQGKNNVFEKTIAHSIDLSPQYSNIIVAEIDTVLEKSNPIKSVKYLNLTSNVDVCATIPGTYYAPNLAMNPVTVYVHSTEGFPSSNRFRYEVTTGRFNINGIDLNGVTYKNLFLQSSGNGVGILWGGDNTVAKNIIFQGGGTHHLVIKSGTIDSCIFLPGPRGLKDRIASIFYEAEGKSNINRLTNSTFLDIPIPIYTHTNGVVNHQSLTIENVYAFGDSTDASQALSSNDTDSISVSNAYAENYPTAFIGVAKSVKIKNSVFLNTNQSAIQIIEPQGYASQVDIDNVLIKTNGNDVNQNADQGWVSFGVRATYAPTNVNVTNTVIYGHSTWSKTLDPALYAFQVNGGKLTSMRNIFICDVNDNRNMVISRADNSGGIGTSTNVNSDYNVFILLRGSSFHWVVEPNNNREGDLLSLAQWQTLTGQDKHSLFIDLRNNPMGLKAIFTDPANGNWNFAPTDIAATVKAIGAGMTTPPFYYPLRPIVSSSESFNTPGGYSSFSGTVKSPNESALAWKTYNEKDFTLFELQSGADSLNYTTVDTIRATADGRNNSYQYTHQHPEVAQIYYRLKITRKDLSVLYSPSVVLRTKIRTGLYLDIFPNPFQNTITVEHPARPNASIAIYELGGRLLQTINIPEGIVETRLPLSNLNKGIYVLRWTTGQESFSSLILK